MHPQVRLSGELTHSCRSRDSLGQRCHCLAGSFLITPYHLRHFYLFLAEAKHLAYEGGHGRCLVELVSGRLQAQ